MIQSLSARRAWIEIAGQPAHGLPSIVALRKESVDRNYPGCRCPPRHWQSLSARRAWIEILFVAMAIVLMRVALRKESVDRNTHNLPEPEGDDGRSPQGERG